jgi:hypothetical protein
VGRLIRDVLDNQLLDRYKRPMGKVDGLILELRPGQPPRLAYIEVGSITLARRLHPWFARWVARWERKLGITAGRPFRIAWEKVRDVGVDVEVEVDIEETPLLGWEHWLSEKIIGKIPGA